MRRRELVGIRRHRGDVYGHRKQLDRADCHVCSDGRATDAAEWIGIDGYAGADTTVEQDGTSSDCASGAPTYDAWFEMYGDSSGYGGVEAELNPAVYPVSPGDVITASVSVSNDDWTLALEDSSG